MLKQLLIPFRYPKINLEQIETPNGNKKRPKAKNTLGTLKRIWAYLALKKGLLWQVLTMVVISSFLSLLGPFLIGMAVDDYIVSKSSSGIGFVLLQLIGVYIFYSIAIFLQNFWMIGIAQHTVFTMRTELFQHLHKLPITFFDKRKTGELMSRVTNDIENVSSTLNSSVIQIFSSVLIIIGTISVMIWISPLLTLITLLIIPLMVLGLKWITKRTSKLFKEQQRNLGDLNGYIEETISGQKIIKTYSQEQNVIVEFKKKNNKLKGSAFWALTFSGFIPKLMNVLNNLSFTIIAGIGGIFALNDMISIGAIVIFAEYSRQFTRPLNDLANQFNTLLSAVAGAERVFDIMDEDKEEHHELAAKKLNDVQGDVKFTGVSFSYEGDDHTIEDIYFHVPAGQTVAFVGPTGAGKTTIISLLSRFYNIDSGTISIDGQDISNISREELRRHMGFVLQDPYLFEGTIMENIRYGRLNARDDEVIEAAKQANAHSFIMKLPNQYNTDLRQDGSGISQGQRQLLSIARAILSDPTILILDEATSSIDTITEIKIQEALQRLMKGRSSFVIAHRLNTIQQADQIFVLDAGKIIERGTHQSLLQEKGFYYGLYQNNKQEA
ncbi:ABC transporter ATP-binding protein/permease [Bacillus timonensis]|nr:ABC transporter ATP-binding protein/permease [Bacillus timonensis]